MFKLSNTLINQDILSLRTGGAIGIATEPIINPNNLKIEGFYCIDRFSNQQLILVTQDIREWIPRGFVVDDHEVLAELDDLIRLKPIADIQFAVIGKPVYTDKRKRIGRVVDFTVDETSLYIQKLYVGQNIMKSLTNGQLTVDRNQIIEITDKKIIVKDPLQGVRGTNTLPVTA